MSKVKEVSGEDQYRDYLRNSVGKLVVVDFYADWCGPCQMAAPQFAALSNKYANVVFLKVNTDKNRSVASSAGVKALPTFMLFKNNMKLTEITGADMQKLENLILQYGDSFEAFKGSGKTLGGGATSLAGQAVDRSLLARRFGGPEPERKRPDPAKQQQQQQDSMVDVEELSEEEQLKRAIELSKQETSSSDSTATTSATSTDQESNKKEQQQPEIKSGQQPVLDIVLDKDEKEPSQEDVDKQVEESVDKKVLQELLEMEFSKTRALKALLATGSKGQEEAIEWLVEHQGDEDIDDPIKFRIITYEERQRQLKEAREKAKQLQAEARKKVEAIEKKAEKEREIRRIKEGKMTHSALKEFEEAQKKREREAAKLEKKKFLEEKARMKRLLEEDKARRKIERLKQEGKLEEAAEVEREFGFTSTAKPTSASTTSSTTATSASSDTSKKEVDECLIRIRLLNGETQACKFNPEDTLKVVFQHAVMLQGNSRFSLMFPHPRKVYKGSDMNMTLKQLGLCPKSQLVCSPAV